MGDVAIQDGQVVIHDGVVGLGQDCCCDGGSSGSDDGSGSGNCCQNGCAANCDTALTLVCDGNAHQQCNNGVWEAVGNRSNNIRNGCESSVNVAYLECVDGCWIVTAIETWCCDPDSNRNNVYAGVAPCDENGIPVAGDVELTFVEQTGAGEMLCEDAAAQGKPVVSITRP